MLTMSSVHDAVGKSYDRMDVGGVGGGQCRKSRR